MSFMRGVALVLAEWWEIAACQSITSEMEYLVFDINGDFIGQYDRLLDAYSNSRAWVVRAKMQDGTHMFLKVVK